MFCFEEMFISLTTPVFVSVLSERELLWTERLAYLN